MLFRLMILFIAVPLAELAVLLWVAKHIGGWETFALVIVTGVVGGALARAEGLKTMQQVQHELAEGRMPGESLLQGAMILVAGALLVTPGILTDAVGLLLLAPASRRVTSRCIMKSLQRHLVFTTMTPPSAEPRRYVSARVRRVDPQATDNTGP